MADCQIGPRHRDALSPLVLGALGVTLFFVLSGYLIHSSFLRSGPRFTFTNYFSRRFWRIVPPYLLALAVFYLWHRTGRIDLLRHAALLHNFSPASFFSINPSFWSLGVEAQYYLIYPVALACRSKIGIGRTLLASIAISAMVTAIGYRRGGKEYLATGFFTGGTLYLWHTWLVGAYAAERVWSRQPLCPMPRVVAGVLLAVFLAANIVPAPVVFPFVTASLFSLLLVRFCAEPRKVWPPLVWLGLCSYSFYLWHQPIVMYAATLAAGWRRAAAFSAGLLVLFPLLFGLSWLLYLAVEKPSIALGRAFSDAIGRRPRRRDAEEQAAP